MAVRAPGIRLDIEHIVLDGLPLANRDRFVRAFTDECAVRLAEAHFESAASMRGRLDLAIAHGASPEAIGQTLARAIIRLVSRS